MKKDMITIFLLSSLLILLSGCNTTEASISRRCSSRITENSSVSFLAQKGDKINIKYDSKVEKGDLEIQLIDINKDVIKNFETNSKGNRKIKINKTGEYILRVSLDRFKGNVNVKAQK